MEVNLIKMVQWVKEVSKDLLETLLALYQRRSEWTDSGVVAAG